MLSEKLRSFSMQDLTLIRDEGTRCPCRDPNVASEPAPAASWTPLKTWVQSRPRAGTGEGEEAE